MCFTVYVLSALTVLHLWKSIDTLDLLRLFQCIGITLRFTLEVVIIDSVDTIGVMCCRYGGEEIEDLYINIVLL